MAESTKKTTNKKAAPKKAGAKPTAKATEPVKAKNAPAAAPKTEVEKAPAAKSSAPAVAIAILSTLIVCIIIAFGALLATGVVKFGDNSSRPSDKDGTNLTGSNQGNDSKDTSSYKTGDIIDNPNRRVVVKDATLASVEDLEFYLPDDFQAGGKNKDGAYTYNLVDDDGWAQALVYVERSSLTPEKYLKNLSSYLDITDINYRMNGTTWVVGENANSLAYATKLDGKIYAVVYNIKLDSDDATEAMSMIPKTLYMKKVYAE